MGVSERNEAETKRKMYILQSIDFTKHTNNNNNNDPGGAAHNVTKFVHVERP